MEFVIITGLSGSGKSCAINALEDIGFFCIDNMPPQLIPKFVEICRDNATIDKVALGTDIRGGAFFLQLNEYIEQLRGDGLDIKVLFLDASHAVIKQRYKETRRKHPLLSLSGDDIDKAIDAEIEMVQGMKAVANYYIDTSLSSSAVCRQNVLNLFMDNVEDSMVIQCVSFGFKYGVPNEADLVFDVRCLPNPFYVPELKHKTGRDKEVRDFVMNSADSKTLFDKLCDMTDFLIPLYVKEGKTQLVIAFGCTGGKHRSVTFAEIVYEHLLQKKLTARILHRDIEK